MSCSAADHVESLKSIKQLNGLMIGMIKLQRAYIENLPWVDSQTQVELDLQYKPLNDLVEFVQSKQCDCTDFTVEDYRIFIDLSMACGSNMNFKVPQSRPTITTHNHDQRY
jgi:hypothetical protein